MQLMFKQHCHTHLPPIVDTRNPIGNSGNFIHMTTFLVLLTSSVPCIHPTPAAPHSLRAQKEPLRASNSVYPLRRGDKPCSYIHIATADFTQCNSVGQDMRPHAETYMLHGWY